MKVFAGGIATETNTFSPMPTGMADFEIIRVADLSDAADNGLKPVMALFQQRTAERSWEFIFSLDAWAQPAGNTT